ncbi:hypothetical protein M422DRAFT_151311 [Sphaerobolus stellatus SS14]|nr:hypothetical protein M422DRAFT_151311 [Sphaerobolus stellatus SS14]
MAALGVGTLIYLGIMPLIKTFITIFFGYLLARSGLFPAAASRGASQVTMNVALPALIFSNIVPAFTPGNISAIGPLLLLAFIYQGIGFILGYIMREFCYVPRNFQQGLVVMCGTTTAVVLSVTQTAPFNPTTDPQLGVSFVSLFVVAYNLVFWVFGAAQSLSWDYLPGVPQGEAAEQRLSWKEKPIGSWVARKFLGQQTPLPIHNEHEVKQSEKSSRDLEAITGAYGEIHYRPSSNESPAELTLERQDSRHSISSIHSRQNLPTITRNTTAVGTPVSCLSLEVINKPPSSPSITKAESPVGTPSTGKTATPTLHHILKILKVFLTPVTISLILSLPIAVIKPLKALFVDTTAMGGPNWHGPDGRPPLFFVIDTAGFVGNVAVPMALILLGASFARLNIPRPISRLPLTAMVLVSVVKMVVMPVIGIFIVQAMVRSGFIPKANKAERFVAMFLSGTPAAVNQLIATQLYSPDGTADTLSVRFLQNFLTG